MELSLFLRPDGFQGLYLFDHFPEACFEYRAVVLHFLGVPAATDAEQKTPARKAVKAGDFLGHGNGVALDDQTNAGADLDGAGDRSGEHEGDERVVGMAVFLGQFGAPPATVSAGCWGCGCAREPHRDSKPRASASRARSSIRIA